MKIRSNYFKTDIYRLWHSGRLFLGAALVYVAMMFNSLLYFRSVDVLLLYFRTRVLSTTVLVYIGCAVPFATVFVEDFNRKYAVPQVVRGKVPFYVLSKVLMCFISSILSMAVGMTLFVFTYSFKYPLCVVGTSIFDFYASHDIFGGLLTSGHYMLYFLASACLTGMFGGLLSILAMYLSLFVKNKLYVISIPMIAHYFIDNYILNWLKLPYYFSPVYIFSSEMGAWEYSSVKSVLYACGVSAVGIVVFTLLITKRVGKELQGCGHVSML